MIRPNIIELFIEDEPVLSSLRFSLAIEGFPACEGCLDDLDPSPARLLVIDQSYHGDGLGFLTFLRTSGCRAAAIFLATNPNARLRSGLAALGAQLIEKPLLPDELSRAITPWFEGREAA